MEKESIRKECRPKWIEAGYKYIGVHEIKGEQHHPNILQWWKDIKRGGIRDDETPWCAAYVGAMFEHVGICSSRFESAKSYLEWGIPLKEPHYGCVAVFTRVGGGHVGFVVGVAENSDLMVLGGNQSDEVNIRAFPRSRVSGYRWPSNEPINNKLLSLMAGSHSECEE
ncbi:TIGR02594 family protein [Xenorhabdus bovienii]|uniref:TIGR02594 family protein n=1 Tax=Xenorhabdus bovienii TaxID=40576 RepID=A0AAJ1J8R6_XENBV|nr:TIGR02594 family protein [Xenorhabdus bovienii]MDE1478327.1 TIGR02594 family protein [Xenorhabdus bovienii]MDE9510183.1 TIGR02594 family protein [Xenorhabdus bovienii]MDE9521824.1 TIGR02594 family protein [Xenorhabdus bovienii]